MKIKKQLVASLEVTKKRTKAELAALLEISRQALARLQQRPDCPDQDAPLDNWLDYQAMVGREGSAPPDLKRAIAEQRLRLVKENADRAAIENARRRGETIDKAELNSFMREVISNYFQAELRRMTQEYPAILKGKTEVEIAMECNKRELEIGKGIMERINKLRSK
jgi:phage terminase Nu1 subunit (DNA packaging protein)